MPPAFAGFWRRLAALLIDSMLLAGVQAGLALVVELVAPDVNNAARVLPVGAAISWAYFALLESSPAQATLGKVALGIRVTGTDGSVISFRRASARYWLKLASTLVLGLGWLLAVMTPRRQALHDVLAGTLVIRSVAVPASEGHWDPAIGAYSEHWDGTEWMRETR